MRNFIKVNALIFNYILLSGRVAQDSNDDENKFKNIEFSITSQGTQSDVSGEQVITVKNSNMFDEVSLRIPSISGSAAEPNFEENQATFLLSNISACSSLEITQVSENIHTRLITVTEVKNTAPGLCDPSPESITNLEYAIIEYKRAGLPVSILYETRNNY